ncbi:hypothetical protein ACJIZ3_024214 [Penstemon smallii]|uniref:Uncharacterized protein n=1 Tax=Penstemon smallii TaxID=265156 RepID=A0ABD3TTP7_9LAMI
MLEKPLYLDNPHRHKSHDNKLM